MSSQLLILLTAFFSFAKQTIHPASSVEAADSLKIHRQVSKRLGLEKRAYLSLNLGKYKRYRPITIDLPVGVDESTVIVTVKGEALTLDTDYVINANPKQLIIINPKIVGSNDNVTISYVRPKWGRTN